MRNLTAKERLFCAISTLLRFMAQCSTRHQGRWRLVHVHLGTKINTDMHDVQKLSLSTNIKTVYVQKTVQFPVH